MALLDPFSKFSDLPTSFFFLHILFYFSFFWWGMEMFFCFLGVLAWNTIVCVCVFLKGCSENEYFAIFQVYYISDHFTFKKKAKRRCSANLR